MWTLALAPCWARPIRHEEERSIACNGGRPNRPSRVTRKLPQAKSMIEREHTSSSRSWENGTAAVLSRQRLGAGRIHDPTGPCMRSAFRKPPLSDSPTSLSAHERVRTHMLPSDRKHLLPS